MPEFVATMTFEVVYRAKQSELTTSDRADALAETMLAVLRGSAKVKVVDLQCVHVGDVELLDHDEGTTPLRIEQ